MGGHPLNVPVKHFLIFFLENKYSLVL